MLYLIYIKDLLSKLHGLANDNGQATKCEASADGSNLAVNLLVQFFFRELRWQGAFRHYLFRKINQEMDDLLAKGQVRKIIKSLKVSLSCSVSSSSYLMHAAF